jgi:hypothetical protein
VRPGDIALRYAPVIRLRALTAALIAAACAIAAARPAAAAPVVWSASGANPAAIQATVDAFRASLGALNPNNGQSFTSGRREINWDGVPDNFASPNDFPPAFFNVNSPRGAVFTTPCSNAQFRVSADNSNPTTTAIEFGDLDASYPAAFQPFSPQRLFTVLSGAAVPCNILETRFFVPGTDQPATVSAFGVVFTDVDTAEHARIIAYAPDGSLLGGGAVSAPVAAGGLSFVAVAFDAGERIGHVAIVSGNARLAAAVTDGGGTDVVAMDDFIYGEPRPLIDCLFGGSFESCLVP